MAQTEKMRNADQLFQRIEHDPELQTPMAALVIRFSGEKLPHVGNAMFSAVELALACTDKEVTYRGWLMSGPRQSARNAKPAKGAGLKAVREALATQQKMPSRTPAEAKEQTGSTAFALHFKDGDPRSLAPESFGLYFSLLDDPKKSFSTTKGFLMLGLPLGSLEDPAKWFQIAEKMIAILQAEVAWMGPALWLIPQHLLSNDGFNDSPRALIPLFGRTPQVDVPSLYASRWPFPTDEGEFDPFSGFVAPAWTLWAHAPLAEKIKSFPGRQAVLPDGHVRFQLSEQVPFDMTDVLYAEWKTN